MHGMKHWVAALSVVCTAVFLPLASSAGAEPWPQRPVRVIVPIGPTTATDLAARLFAERLSERWKQPVVVENRPGADGLIGTAAFAGMRDDHALLFSFAAPISVHPLVKERLGYDPTHDLVPIARASETFAAVAAAASLKIRSLSELVALARLQPGNLNYRAGGGVFPTLFAGFLKSTGLEMVQIAYREEALSVQDLGEGRVQLMLTSMTAVLPQVQSGKARLLAVTNKMRAPLAPDVPTAIEAGYPELAFEGLLGFFGPGNIPTERRDRISADVREVAADPTLADRLAAVGQLARGSTPAEFAAAIEEQRARMASIVKLLGIKPTP